jgi:hypothetical protein
VGVAPPPQRVDFHAPRAHRAVWLAITAGWYPPDAP